MRAWLLEDSSGPEAWHLGSVETPRPGPRDVRVALKASALNHLDLWVSKGLPKPPAFPHVGGADGAGVIDVVGEDVDGLSVGQEVLIDPSTSCGVCDACDRGDIPFCTDFKIVGEHRWGTHAEHIVIPAVNAAPKPASLGWPEAAAFGLVTSSALRMLRRARLAPGETALVVGVGGGTSIAAFALAPVLGATAVFATSRQAWKRAWALENGADGAFDSDGAFDEEVRSLTGGRGVDVVIENVGTATWERSMRSLARGGRLVTNGSTTGRTAQLHLPTLFWRQLEVIGSTMNDHREFDEAAELVAEGRVRIPVDTTFGFDEFPAALERLESGEQLGKIVLGR
ncbi:MAG: zinc-binding dehydrogenase [Actinomycetota bacterium]